MTLPKLITEEDRRHTLLAALYELGDALAAISTYLLVFDGPTDDIDLDELMVGIRTDSKDAVRLWNLIQHSLLVLREYPFGISREGYGSR